jgi:Domain of unknown function (DUF4384)
MRIVIATALALACLSQARIVTAQAPPSGAKELFFDPTDGTVVTASDAPRTAASPTATAPPAVPVPPAAVATDSTPAAPAKPPTRTRGPGGARYARAKLDGKGRRAVEHPNASNTTLGLSYWIELVGPDQTTGAQVTESRTFHSGEKIRVHFRSNADGYISLIQLGASGSSNILFPEPAKGLSDNRLSADQDRVLPSEKAWFRFDSSSGTETLLVLFGRNADDLRGFPVEPSMDSGATQALLRSTGPVRGSKDLILEMEPEKASEVGTYAVSLRGKPIVLEIKLKHQ